MFAAPSSNYKRYNGRQEWGNNICYYIVSHYGSFPALSQEGLKRSPMHTRKHCLCNKNTHIAVLLHLFLEAEKGKSETFTTVIIGVKHAVYVSAPVPLPT